MNKARIAPVTAFLVVAGVSTGCSTKTHYSALDSASAHVSDCRGQVVQIQQARASSMPAFADGRDAILWQVIQGLTAGNEFQTCDDALVALINAEASRLSALNGGLLSLGSSLVFGTAAVLVADDLVDGLTSSSSTTYNNSRVTTVGDANSGVQASSSGETLNLGTVSAVNESQAQGGLEPRQSQEQGDGYLDGPSQSGTNAQIDISPGDDMITEPEPEPSE